MESKILELAYESGGLYESDRRNYIKFLKEVIIESSKEPKQLTNYALICDEYDKIVENETTKKCEKLVKDEEFKIENLLDLTDEELIIMISLKYIADIYNFCASFGEDEESEESKNKYILWDPILKRLQMICDNENYSWFFKLFHLATSEMVHFDEIGYEIYA